MNIRKQKRREEEEQNKKRERKVYNRLCLLGSLMLLFVSFFGTARGMKESVITIFSNSPSEGLPYIIITVILTIIAYFVLRFFRSKEYR